MVKELRVGMTGRLVIEGVLLAGTADAVDIHVDAGVITEIRPTGSAGREFIAIPGLVDLHTHLREPGGEAAETIATGTRAAAAGGYTDVFAMPNTNPVTDTVERVRALRTRAHGASARVHPVAAATIGESGEQLVDVAALRTEGIAMFSDDGQCLTDEGLVHDLLKFLAGSGGFFAQHAQSKRIVGAGVINARVADAIGCGGWPSAGEEAIVARDIAIARATGGRLHICHASTRRTVELIRWAKSVGAPVTAEVTPHHLALTDDDAVERGPALKVNPPLRSRDDVLALREALRDGTIDIVGTDHAPHPRATKELPWPKAAFGMTAIETALPVVAEVLADSQSGAVDWERLVEVMSTAPARIGGIPSPGGGRLAVGSAADFCVVEAGGPWPIEAARMLSASANTPFDQLPVRHRVVLTVLGGRVTHAV
jgi:dihydroorotase